MSGEKRTFTAADVAAAFQAGIELGQRAELTPDSTAAYLNGYADGQRAERPTDDGGFAEEFLQRQRQARLDRERVAGVLDSDDPAPTGLDPEAIAAARSIARALNGGGR